LNTIIIKNYYPLPLIQEILARLSKTKIYTKLDVIAVFNRIRIIKRQEYLIVFNIYYSLYETLVILFGLSNAPIIFQAYINKILYLYLDIFCITYIDDILVYSNDLTSYKQYVRFIIEALRDAGLQFDIKKYEFEVTEITYLSIIVSTDSMRINPAKIIIIMN
jgi:Reverse transcriptase (RNA-dependent DNA polymerase)